MLSTSLDIVNGRSSLCFLVFFFNDTATTEIYTLSLHDALPIWLLHGCRFKLADGFGIHRLLFVRPSEVHVSPETGGLDLQGSSGRLDRLIVLARKQTVPTQTRVEHGIEGVEGHSPLGLSYGLTVAPHDQEEVGVVVVNVGIARIQLERAAEVLLRVGPVPVAV